MLGMKATLGCADNFIFMARTVEKAQATISFFNEALGRKGMRSMQVVVAGCHNTDKEGAGCKRPAHGGEPEAQDIVQQNREARNFWHECGGCNAGV